MLPRDFLAQMAHDHELSKEQEDVFLLRLADGKSYSKIAAELKTSPDACLKRMGQVYNKFNVSGSSRGKENRLRIFLLNQYQQQNSQASEAITPLPTHTESPPTAIGDSELIGGQPLIRRISPKRIYENLPHRDCTTFIGRQKELTRLLEVLSFQHSAHLISVDGIGGVGKTTLVLEAAYRCLQVSATELMHYSPTPENVGLSPPHNWGAFPQNWVLRGASPQSVPIFEAIIFTSAKQQYLTALGLLTRLK
ncbi:MAG TPA: RNA polymerase subunit sigma-24, partial [Cyanophyceae cyanobacterium]